MVVNCIIFLPLIFLPLIHHCVEVMFDLALEIHSDLIDIAKFDKGPPSKGLEVVDAWNPYYTSAYGFSSSDTFPSSFSKSAFVPVSVADVTGTSKAGENNPKSSASFGSLKGKSLT